MKSIKTAFVAAATVATAALSLAAAVPAAKPNIIFILSDDVGIDDIGCYGGRPFKTPHIDTLAQGGTRFEYCYSAPVCGPSRCQLLTGRYPFRTGLINNNRRDAVAPNREVMVSTVMKKAGYVTASVGKWGQICLGPGEWGFDEYLAFPGNGRYWRNQTASYKLGQWAGNYKVNGQEKDLPAGQYLPDIMHNFIVEFLSKHKDQPFFLYYPMSHVHRPVVHTPESKTGDDSSRLLELYADNVDYMDKLVGKLISELERLHLREKTLVVFSGDNGTAHFAANATTVNGRRISGWKGTMLEGGSRVPLIVNWPGVTPAGKVNHDLTDFSDFFSTFAELGGAKLPDGVKIDGHSFAAQIKGQVGTPREWVYVEYNGRSYVRDTRFKLTNGGELFDLSEAPYQEIPVPKTTTDAAALAAQKHLQELLKQLPAAPADIDATE